MIIVSGASGFVGRRLATRLAVEQPRADLRCLVKDPDDAFGQSGTDLLRAHGIKPVGTDLVTGRGLSGLGSPEVLFHLAANTHTWERDQSCNDVGTDHLLRALQPLGPQTHVVFTSTVAVMDNRRLTGATGAGGGALRAETPVEGPPLSQYGRTKWRAEQLLRDECRRQGFRLTVVRLCTVYGPGPRPNSFFDVLKREVAGFSLASRLNWPGLTSFVHVEDVVSCLLRVAEEPPSPGEPRILLLATESRTLQEASSLLYRAMGLPYRMIRWPAAGWALLGRTHGICRRAGAWLPPSAHNFLWRFNLVVNPVFDCDLAASAASFPRLRPRRMAESVVEI